MDKTTKQNISIGTKIYDFLSKRVVYHMIFWIIFFLALFYAENIDSPNDNLLFAFSNELINIFFYALIIYFNLFYLIPNYFRWDKLPHYLGLLSVSVIIITPLKLIVFYLKFHNYPVMQEALIAKQYSIFTLHFLVAGFSTIFKIVSDWAKHQREKHELETKTMESELNFLRSQINPHFLFNTLNNLYALTLKKSDKAPEIVIKLSEMMRYMLYECNEKEVPLIKEVNYLRNYLDLEKLRQSKEIDIKLKVNGMVTNQRIAPLMFIPFIENSFKHGLKNQINDGFVHITLDVKRDNVHLHVINSKAPALPVRSGKRSGGIGLVNVQKRLSLIYPKQHELSIKDNPNDYEVDLTIEF